MQPLEKYSKNGFRYSLIKREGDVAIFEQRTKSGGLIGYEVIVIRVRPEAELGGRIIPAHEAAPSNEDFGTYGWYFRSLKYAETKMHDVIEARKKRATKRK